MPTIGEAVNQLALYDRRVGYSIAAWIEAWTDDDRVAFHFEGATTTYDQFVKRIDHVARGLVASGVQLGDRVAYCGLNRVEVFETLFAAARIGAIFLPLNNRLTVAELGELISDARPALILAADGFGELISAAAPHSTIRDIDIEPFEESGATLPMRVVAPDTPLLMMYTSGTTGRSKGAVLSQNAIVYGARNAVDYQRLTADDTIVAALPTFHIGGLNVQTIPALTVGARVVLHRRFDPGDVLAAVPAHQVTQMVLVPAMLDAVAGHRSFGLTDLSSITGIVSGSSVVPTSAMQPFFDRGIPVGQMYGLTETGPTAIALGFEAAADHLGSCGKAAAHTELRIVDLRGADVETGVAGEVWVRGPNIFSEYWENPAGTQAAFAPGEWFRTGDVGFEDDEGYIYISDRIKDVVISGGENVYPAEVEPVLAEHPAIAEVSVIGQADERWGEVPVAVIVLAEGATLDIDELRRWCDDRLARFKQPQVIRLVDRLPRTALGKVMKHELRRV